MRALLAVDWDDTCVENEWPGMGLWLPGAVKNLKRLSEHMDICIFTMRTAPVEFGSEIPRDPLDIQWHVDGITYMLEEAGLPDVTIWTKPYKPPAFAFIDDRGIHYNGRKGAWDALYTRVMLTAGLEPVEEKSWHDIAELDDPNHPDNQVNSFYGG